MYDLRARRAREMSHMGKEPLRVGVCTVRERGRAGGLPVVFFSCGPPSRPIHSQFTSSCPYLLLTQRWRRCRHLRGGCALRGRVGNLASPIQGRPFP